MEGEQLLVRERPTVGIVIRDAFTLFSSHMPQFLTIAALTLTPMIAAFVLMMVAAPDPVRGGRPEPAYVLGFAGAVVAAVLLFLIGTQLASAALTYGVFQIERGLPLRVGSCLTIGLRRLPVVLLVSVVVGVLSFTGLLLCIVPGVIIALAFSMAVPATVVEGHFVGAALRRSVDLTRGFRWTVFGSFAVLALIQFAVDMVIATIGIASQVLSSVLSLVTYVVFASLQATTLAVLYYRLRAAKGALDVDQIAAVFE